MIKYTSDKVKWIFEPFFITWYQIHKQRTKSTGVAGGLIPLFFVKFRCFGLYGVLLRETYKNDSQGYFSNVTLYFTGKCSVKYPPGRVEYAETTKFILSFLYIVTVQCFYSVMAKCKSPLLMVIISLHFTKVKKRFLNVSDFAWLNWRSVLCLIHG